MFQKLKQYKDLRDKAKDLRSKLAQESVVAEAKGVSVVMDGNQEIMRVEVKDELLSTDRKSQLESGVKEAVNDALKKVQKIMIEKMRNSGDFNLPGLS